MARTVCINVHASRRNQPILTGRQLSSAINDLEQRLKRSTPKGLRSCLNNLLGEMKLGGSLSTSIYWHSPSESHNSSHISELRVSLDSLRTETENQASSHAALCKSMRTELEDPATAFVTKQAQFKKTAYSNIEKAFKVKQQQESIVAKV